jgi:hypothetical protein
MADNEQTTQVAVATKARLGIGILDSPCSAVMDDALQSDHRITTIKLQLQDLN